MNRGISQIVFQDNVSADADGEILSVGCMSETVNIEVETTSTTAILNFEIQQNSDEWHEWNGIDTITYDIVTSVLATNKVYQSGLTGVRNFRVRISNMTDGTITVTGKAVG